VTLGVPYGDEAARAPEMAREQARQIATGLVSQGGPSGMETKEIVAMIAYLQRLGKDIRVATAGQAGPTQPGGN